MSIRRAPSWDQPLVVRREPRGARIFRTGSLAVFAIICRLLDALRRKYIIAARSAYKTQKKRLTRGRKSGIHEWVKEKEESVAGLARSYDAREGYDPNAHPRHAPVAGGGRSSGPPGPQIRAGPVRSRSRRGARRPGRGRHRGRRHRRVPRRLAHPQGHGPPADRGPHRRRGRRPDLRARPTSGRQDVDADFCRTSPAEPRELPFLRTLGRRRRARPPQGRRRPPCGAPSASRRPRSRTSSTRSARSRACSTRAFSARSRSAWPSRRATSGPRRSASGSRPSSARSTGPTTSAASSTSSPTSATSSRPGASRSTSWRRTRPSAATSSPSSGTTPS